jgi:hypothetical protein
MSTPDLHIRTCFVLDDDGRIIGTREPSATRGPLFTLVKSQEACAWAVRADVPPAVAKELNELAQDEPPALDPRQAPVYSRRYISLLEGRIPANELSERKTVESDGPAFEFPDSLVQFSDVVIIEDERLLNRNFTGWIPGEIEAGRSPVLAIVENGYPVSVCFCARRSEIAAEAGVATAEAYRGKGFGPRVTAAWALAVRGSGRIPLYSTSWANHASLAVAKKLNLLPYASSWALCD